MKIIRTEESTYKLPHANVYSYTTYSQLFTNSKPSLDYLRAQLFKIDLIELVLLLSKLNLIMTDDKYAINFDFHNRLISAFIDDYSKRKLDHLSRRHKEGNIVFNRHQLLFLMKQAFQLCSKGIQSDFKKPSERYRFGKCGLIANDFLTLAHFNNEQSGLENDDSSKELTWKELLPGYELYIKSDLAHSISRNKILFERILPAMQINESYIEMNDLFESIANVTINEYRAIIFAIIALYLKRRDEMLDNPNAILFDSGNLTANTKLSDEKVNRVLSMISIPLEQTKKEIQASKDKELNYGFLVFKKYPLLNIVDNKYICLDFNFLQDKLTNGVF